MRVATPLAFVAITLALLVTPGRAESTREVVLERISTAVPWPRGVRILDGKLIVLARGAHRSAGGPKPDVADMAGHLYVVDPAVSERVVKGVPPGEAVKRNGAIFAAPQSPPFRLYGGQSPATEDVLTDRPYCTLAYDEASRNFFICGYAGIDMGEEPGFRKNATDSIHRYDLRTRKWYVVEAHDPSVVPPEELKKAIAPRYYPHHDPPRNAPPHGLVNGACGAIVCGDYLYVGAKDNTALAQYDLRGIREDPNAGPPPGKLIFSRSSPEDDVFLRTKHHGKMYVEGACAIATHGGYLYVAFRTTSQILRFPVKENGDLVRPLVGEYIAQCDPYDPVKKGGSGNIYDMTFDREGFLYVAPAYTGAVFRFKPEPRRVYQATVYGEGEEPYVNLRALTDHAGARTGNIAVDDAGNLYICSGVKDDPEGNLRGAVYRVPAR